MRPAWSSRRARSRGARRGSSAAAAPRTRAVRHRRRPRSRRRSPRSPGRRARAPCAARGTARSRRARCGCAASSRRWRARPRTGCRRASARTTTPRRRTPPNRPRRASARTAGAPGSAAPIGALARNASQSVFGLHEVELEPGVAPAVQHERDLRIGPLDRLVPAVVEDAHLARAVVALGDRALEPAVLRAGCTSVCTASRLSPLATGKPLGTAQDGSPPSFSRRTS